VVEILTGIARNLLLIVVVASFLEILLPDNSMRPFVRFTIGLFIILAILNPILSAFYSERDLEAQAWDLPWEYQEDMEFEDVGIQVNREIQAAGSDVMKEKIARQINSLAILVPGVQDLETEVDLDPESGGLSRVTLVIKAAPASGEEDESVETFFSSDQTEQGQELIREKLAGLMRNLYGMEGQQVVIKFEGG
jgi:stage III sporulation protein AF